MEENLRKILFRNTITSYINLSWRMITTIFITRIIFFGLGDELYGYWALLWTIFGYALLLDFGFGASVQKYTAEASVSHDFKKFNEMIAAVVSSYLIMSLFIMLFTLIAAYYLEDIFSLSHMSDIWYCKKVFIIFGLGIALVFPSGALSEILMGLKRTDIKNYVLLITYTINIIGIYLIFRLKYSIMTLTVFTVLINGSANFIIYIILKKLLPEFKFSLKYFKWSAIKEIGSFSFYSYLLTIATLIIYRTDKMVLGVIVGMNAVAIYQIGTRISEIMEQFSSQFQNSLPAVAASLHKTGDKEKIRWILLRSIRLTVFIGTGIFVILFLQTKQILNIWLKVQNNDSILIAYIMLISVLFVILFRSTSFKFLQMAGKHKPLAVIMVIECIVNIVASIILVKTIGVIGVAIGTLVPNIIISVFVVFPMFVKFSNFSLFYYLKKVYFPICIVAIPSIIVLLTGIYLVPPEEWGIIRLAVFSFVSGGIYLLMGYLIYFTKEEKKKYLELIPLEFVRKLLIRE
ncbi:MAG: oligosaccharide flippase family protein [bacterium]|nr:oligosaccharide flippase family protein [bacterium]